MSHMIWDLKGFPSNSDHYPDIKQAFKLNMFNTKLCLSHLPPSHMKSVASTILAVSLLAINVYL